MQTEAGSAAVTSNQAGFVPDKGRVRPRLLEATPAFFKPGPHEAEINLKHTQIQQAIAQRREERRKVIQDLRANCSRRAAPR